MFGRNQIGAGRPVKRKRYVGDGEMELTKEQNDLCYKLKLSIIRAIVNTDNELIWEIVKKEIEKEGEVNEINRCR